MTHYTQNAYGINPLRPTFNASTATGYPVAVEESIGFGKLVAWDGVAASPATATGSGLVLGWCRNQQGVSGSYQDAEVYVDQGVMTCDQDGSLKPSDLFKIVYVKDDHTVSKTGALIAGIFWAQGNDNQVFVDTRYNAILTILN
jgi:hypothetical protein